jgi:hypothetical protein
MYAAFFPFCVASLKPGLRYDAGVLLLAVGATVLPGKNKGPFCPQAANWLNNKAASSGVRSRFKKEIGFTMNYRFIKIH